jgi:RNA polymerase sigma factor (sigma-70 family)
MDMSLPSATEADLGPADHAVISEVNGGNREMFEVIVRRYNQRLYRIGMAYLHHHVQAEEAMQDSYIKAFLHLRRFNGQAAFSTWLIRIMINECLMLLRQRRRSPLPGELGMDELARQSHPHDGSHNLSLKEMKSLLENAIGELPRKYQAVYMLREIEKLSTEETAASLKISGSDVKITLMRAREKLKARLLKSAEGVELFSYRAIFCDPMVSQVMSRVLTVS